MLFFSFQMPSHLAESVRLIFFFFLFLLFSHVLVVYGGTRENYAAKILVLLEKRKQYAYFEVFLGCGSGHLVAVTATTAIESVPAAKFRGNERRKPEGIRGGADTGILDHLYKERFDCLIFLKPHEVSQVYAIKLTYATGYLVHSTRSHSFINEN